MNLKERTIAHVRSSGDTLIYSVVSADTIAATEAELGFQLPQLLIELYQELGNGGFGPGLGVLGIGGGHIGDFGDVVGTYRQLRGDAEAIGIEWQTTLLPFCDWGCNTYSCVQCDNSTRIHTFEAGKAWRQNYTLDAFFDMWLRGIDILLEDPDLEVVTHRIRNPFTGEMIDATSRRRRRP